MSGPIAFFEIQWRPSDSDGEWQSMTLNPSASVATIKGVDRGKAYTIRARSVGPTNLKSAWVDISHTVANNAAPDTPTDAVARGVIDGVRLDWEYPKVQTSDTQASIERAVDPGGPWVFTALVPGTSAIVPEDGLDEVFYRIRAKNYQGHYSNYSATVSARPVPNELPTKVLTIVGGIVEIDCYYKQFYLELTENVTGVTFINTSISDTLLIEVKQMSPGSHTMNFGSSVVPISGVTYVPSTTVGAVDVLGLNTVNSGVTWRMTYQKPATGTGGGSFTVSIAPDPASNEVETDGVTPVAPSVTVTATPTGASGAVTHSWTRADAGGTNFLIDNAALAAPTFSIPSGTTGYSATQQWRDTATDGGTSVTAQDLVTITLSRILNLLDDSFNGMMADAYGGGTTGPTGGIAWITFKRNGTWECWGANQSDGTTYAGTLKASGNWHGSPTTTIGDQYEVIFTPTGTGGTLTNGASAYAALNAGRTVQLELHRTGSGSLTVDRNVAVTVRKISDTSVNVSGTMTLEVTGDNS